MEAISLAQHIDGRQQRPPLSSLGCARTLFPGRQLAVELSLERMGLAPGRPNGLQTNGATGAAGRIIFVQQAESDTSLFIDQAIEFGRIRSCGELLDARPMQLEGRAKEVVT